VGVALVDIAGGVAVLVEAAEEARTNVVGVAVGVAVVVAAEDARSIISCKNISKVGSLQIL